MFYSREGHSSISQLVFRFHAEGRERSGSEVVGAHIALMLIYYLHIEDYDTILDVRGAIGLVIALISVQRRDVSILVFDNDSLRRVAVGQYHQFPDLENLLGLAVAVLPVSVFVPPSFGPAIVTAWAWHCYSLRVLPLLRNFIKFLLKATSPPQPDSKPKQPVPNASYSHYDRPPTNHSSSTHLCHLPFPSAPVHRAPHTASDPNRAP